MIVCFSPSSDGAVPKVVWLSCGLVLPSQTEHVGMRRELTVRWLLYLTLFFVQQVAREQNLEKSLSNETLENDCSQILERRKLMNTVYNLRRELRRAEVLQDKVSGAVQIPAGGQWVIQADEAPAMFCLWSRGAAQQ